jgi:integrase
MQITRRIKKSIGIAVNPHFFRHLVAHLYLVRHPGRYDVVQHLLGHSSVETTKMYYCGEEAEAALRHVAACLEEVKLEINRLQPA